MASPVKTLETNGRGDEKVVDSTRKRGLLLVAASTLFNDRQTTSAKRRKGAKGALHNEHGTGEKEGVRVLDALVALGWEVRLWSPCALAIELAGSEMGPAWRDRVIVCRDRTLVRADYLIDDAPPATGIAAPIWNLVLFERPHNCVAPAPARLKGWHLETLIDLIPSIHVPAPSVPSHLLPARLLQNPPCLHVRSTAPSPAQTSAKTPA